MAVDDQGAVADGVGKKRLADPDEVGFGLVFKCYAGADARVDNGLTGANYGFSITDSQGRFALVNLPNVAYNIGVWRDGYHFEPFNNAPNSITLNNGSDNNMVWTATQLPVVSLTTITSGTRLPSEPAGLRR